MALAPSGKDFLESDIQHRLMDRARARGCYVRKLVSQAYRGFPDLLIIRDGVVLFVEVKRTNGKRTHLQRLEHLAMNKAGANITVTFGLYEAFAVLDRWFP
jgi:Holliday junction resolvase